MPSTILGRHYRYLLDKRGLAIAPSAHEERFALKLADGDITVDPHPRAVREALLIAKRSMAKAKASTPNCPPSTPCGRISKLRCRNRAKSRGSRTRRTAPD